MKKVPDFRKANSVDVLFIIDREVGNLKKNVNDKIKDLSFELRVNFPKTNFHFGCIQCSSECSKKIQSCDLNQDFENLSDFLEGLKDISSNYIEALEEAFQLTWKSELKLIIWISSSCAYGERFGGHSSFDAEPQLESLVQRIAREQFCFIGLDIEKGAAQTFAEMKKIYELANGPYFKICDFSMESRKELKDFICFK